MKTAILITSLLLLFVANIIMMYYAPYGLSPMEGFQNVAANESANAAPAANAAPVAANGAANAAPANAPAAGNAAASSTNSGAEVTEAFQSYNPGEAGGAGKAYQPIGAFDNVALPTGNNVSQWRYTAPNEPLMGPAFEPGPDSLFMFKNNQCKPECCGASFSCGGGCVCTTPQQRQYIASRGGNRTQPEDSA